MMIAALWSNPNFDDEKGTRKGAIEDIDTKCEDAIQIILTGIDPDEEVEVDDKYGFFEAGRRGQAKILAPRDDEGTVSDVVGRNEYAYDVDQG